MSHKDLKLFAATMRKDLPTLDIHGRRVHEVREALDFFVADLIAKNETEGKIIYGVGTGALREAVLKELKTHFKVVTISEQPGHCIFIHQ